MVDIIKIILIFNLSIKIIYYKDKNYIVKIILIFELSYQFNYFQDTTRRFNIFQSFTDFAHIECN